MVTQRYIPKGLVTFKPDRREFHRYESAEMCGPHPGRRRRRAPAGGPGRVHGGAGFRAGPAGDSPGSLRL